MIILSVLMLRLSMSAYCLHLCQLRNQRLRDSLGGFLDCREEFCQVAVTVRVPSCSLQHTEAYADLCFDQLRTDWDGVSESCCEHLYIYSEMVILNRSIKSDGTKLSYT